ncbi:hypothetical protein Tco_0231352 [Tanacetum coccineum]
MMSFLTAVVTSRYPTTNNQLRTSSNPRQQAMLPSMMEKVTVQPVPRGDKLLYDYGTTRNITLCAMEANTGKQSTVICYNCKREGPILAQAVRLSPVEKDETWVQNDKVLLGQSSSEVNGSDALTEVLNPDNLTYDLFNQSEQIMTSSEQSNDVSQSETEINYDSKIIPFLISEVKHNRKLSLNSNSCLLNKDVMILILSLNN